MNIIEKYNKELLGNFFRVLHNDILYEFGEILHGHKEVIIMYDHNKVHNDLRDVFRLIKNGNWILDVNETRRRKIKKLLENG